MGDIGDTGWVPRGGLTGRRMVKNASQDRVLVAS